jgi:hypothetical protein
MIDCPPFLEFIEAAEWMMPSYPCARDEYVPKLKKHKSLHRSVCRPQASKSRTQVLGEFKTIIKTFRILCSRMCTSASVAKEEDKILLFCLFVLLWFDFRYLFCADQQQTPGSNKAEGLTLDERVATQPASNSNKKVIIFFVTLNVT